MATLLPVFEQYSDANGDPLSGGSVTFYENNTTTLQTVYSDPALATPWANPITLDPDGRIPGIVYAPDSTRYTIVLKDSTPATIESRNDVFGYREDTPGAVNAADSGMDPSNTNNATALSGALTAASGRTLKIDAGVYQFDLDATTQFTPGADTTICGDGDTTVLQINNTDTATKTVFDMVNGSVKFCDLKIEFNTIVASATTIIFNLGDDSTLDHVTIDGGVAAANHTVQCTSIPATGSVDGVLIEKCNWSAANRTYLRSNGDTTAVTRMKVSKNYFHDISTDAIALNSPSGICDDVLIEGNTFFDVALIAVAIGSATNVRVVNNFAEDVDEFCHMEEKVEAAVITGNIVDSDCSNRCIFSSDNNFAAEAIPKDNVIANNILRRKTNGTARGVEIANNGSPTGIRNTIIADNVLVGWADGIFDSTAGGDGLSIHGNQVNDCTTGISAILGNSQIRDNVIKNATTGLSGQGGMFGKNTFHNCTTPISSTAGEMSVLGATLVYDRTDLVGGNNDFVLMSAGANDQFDGYISMHAYGTDTHEDVAGDYYNFDGSSLTQPMTGTGVSQSGGNLTLSVVDDTTNLVMRANNSGGTLSDASLQADMSGLLLID